MSAFCIIISHFLLRSINKKLNHGVKFQLWPKKQKKRAKNPTRASLRATFGLIIFTH